MKQRGCDGKPRSQFPCEVTFFSHIIRIPSVIWFILSFQFCDKIFSRKDNLREHVKGHTGHSRPRTKLPCPISSCSKKFQGRTQLQVHLNAHSGARPFECGLCDKSFRSNAALKKHVRVHSEDKPYACTEVRCWFFSTSLACLSLTVN